MKQKLSATSSGGGSGSGSGSNSQLRALKIKMGTVLRTLKDLESYRAEQEDTQRTIDRVRASTDHSKLKQWEDVLAETQAMIPDSATRLYAAVDDLSSLIEIAGDDKGIEGTDELAAAQEALRSAEQALKE